jgi:hypothetical protein
MEKNLLSCFLYILISSSLSAQVKYTYDVSGNRTLSEQEATYPSKPVITSINDTTLSSSTANYYQWFFNNNEVNSATNKTFTFHKVGFYKVGVSPNKQCWAYSDDYPVVVINTPLPDTLAMLIYPNPSSGRFNVNVKLQRATGVITWVTVYNNLGAQILQTNKLIFFASEIRIPVTLSSSGTYSVKVFVNGDSRTQQVLIMK